MVESPTDDRTREDETVVDDSSTTETTDAGAARTAGGSTVRDGTTDAADDTARADDYDDGTARTDDYGDGDDGHPGLLWFSAAGAVILGLLWIIDVTNAFNLTWRVLGSTTTLALAIIAAVGAALFWYDGASDDATTA